MEEGSSRNGFKKGNYKNENQLDFKEVLTLLMECAALDEVFLHQGMC